MDHIPIVLNSNNSRVLLFVGSTYTVLAFANVKGILKEKQLKQKKHSYLKLAFVASLTLVLLMSTQIEKVTAFKNEVFQWIGKDQKQGAIISEVENLVIEPGTYKDLSFEKAQEMTLFHLLKPEFLPEGFQQIPEIEVIVKEYPLLSVRMQFTGDQGEIILFSQENSSGNMKKNTFIPEKVMYERISVGDKEVLFIEHEAAINVQWVENGIHYHIQTYKVKKEDVLKFIRNIK